MTRRWLLAPLALGYLFLFLPIAVVVLLSFNSGESLFRWEGFSLRWYAELAGNAQIQEALGTTLVVALGATAIAVALGTPLAYGIHRHTRRGGWRAYAIAPAVLPDILLALGLAIVFSLAGIALGTPTVILAHAVFDTAFVTAVVLAQLSSLDPSLEEASRDLGAGALRTFWRVTIPQLVPGIVAGALLAFTLSLDEFVIAFFTTAPTSPTLPIVIYSMVRFGVSPEVNALATILLVVATAAVVLVQRLTRLGAPR